MLPDFRFLVGAVLATALLAVTGIGLFSAVKIAHQARIGPLEASRSFAFAPEHGRPPFRDATPRFGMPLHEDPFANLPRGTAPDVVEAPKIVAPEVAAPEVVAQAPSPSVEPETPAPAEAAASTLDEADTVDERAVVDPPLPANDDSTDIAAQPDTQPVAEPSPQPIAEPAMRPEKSAEPTVAASPAPAAAAVEPSAQPEPAAERAHAGSLPPPADAHDPPAAEPVIADTPNADATVDDYAPIADADIVDTPGGDLSSSAIPKAEPKVKPAAKKPAAKKPAARKAVAKKPAAKKAKAKPKVRNTRTVVLQPTAWSGYPVTAPVGRRR